MAISAQRERYDVRMGSIARVTTLTALGVMVALTAVAPLSCGTDGTDGTQTLAADATAESAAEPSPGDAASTPPSSDSGLDEPTKPDATVPLAIAKGDPCRGLALPLERHFVTAGMCARAVATGVTHVRQLTFAPNGDLFAARENGAIVLFRDANGDGVFDASEIHDWASTDGASSTTQSGNNVHIADGFLYAGGPDGVKRWPYVPGALSGGVGEDVVVGQPLGGHPKRTVHAYDGSLYVMSGSYGNADAPAGVVYDTNRSVLHRFNLAAFVSGTPFTWSSGDVVTVGLRNMVGFTRNAAGRLWGVVNGIDGASYDGSDVQQDNPGEQVVELGPGRQYGFPFCFTAQKVMRSSGLVVPGTQVAFDQVALHDDAWCAANSVKPATFVQAHSAPLDILFFEKQPTGVLPERFRGGAFLSFHGSSYRTSPTGYKIVWIPFDASGLPSMPKLNASGDLDFPYETVFGAGSTLGPVDANWSWDVNGTGDTPRPVGIAISPIDGALYVSSDTNVVYRIGLIGSGQ